MLKRKFDNLSSSANSHEPYKSSNKMRKSIDDMEGPSRFDLPEAEDSTIGMFSSFEDLTYNTVPITQASIRIRSNVFESECTRSSTIENIDLKKQSDLVNLGEEEEDNDDWMEHEFLRINDIMTSALDKVNYNCNVVQNQRELDKNCLKDCDELNSSESVNNHAKIIREVLKKYPYLVQQNKNIKLKIMQKDSKISAGSSSGKTKISYVVLKSDFLKMDDPILPNSRIIDIENSEENGPWKCDKCNLNDNYTEYFMFRRHMQDVHNEKFDPRICEYCGYRATKRNILMYHMYTKHDILPPKNMSFPKCQVCSHTALSESLLIKHKISHKHNTPMNLFSTNADAEIPKDLLKYSEYIQPKANIVYSEMNSLHEIASQNGQFHFSCPCRCENLKKGDDHRCHSENYYQTSVNSKFIIEASIPSESALDEENLILLSDITRAPLGINGKTLRNMEDRKEITDAIKQASVSHELLHYQSKSDINIENIYSTRTPLNNDVYRPEEVKRNEHDSGIVQNIKKLQEDVPSQYYQYYHDTNEVVEEVVEELETLEEVEDFDAAYHESLETPSSYKNKNTSISVPAENPGVQYMEEEMEILEYET